MDTAATKLLESATIKTLHAHNFSRSSTQSTLVLTDLLARYFALLSESSAKYAHHAGRTSLTAHDALAALEELGVGIEELAEYGSIEAKELNRYAQHSVRRTEDLNEFKGVLSRLSRVLQSSSFSLQPSSLLACDRTVTTRFFSSSGAMRARLWSVSSRTRTSTWTGSSTTWQ
jgi:Wiskott-Aldrich syndrome protein